MITKLSNFNWSNPKHAFASIWIFSINCRWFESEFVKNLHHMWNLQQTKKSFIFSQDLVLYLLVIKLIKLRKAPKMPTLFQDLRMGNSVDIPCFFRTLSFFALLQSKCANFESRNKERQSKGKRIKKNEKGVGVGHSGAYLVIITSATPLQSFFSPLLKLVRTLYHTLLNAHTVKKNSALLMLLFFFCKKAPCTRYLPSACTRRSRRLHSEIFCEWPESSTNRFSRRCSFFTLLSSLFYFLCNSFLRLELLVYLVLQMYYIYNCQEARGIDVKEAPKSSRERRGLGGPLIGPDFLHYCPNVRTRDRESEREKRNKKKRSFCLFAATRVKISLNRSSAISRFSQYI